MDIFKMANQLANNMSSEDKDAMENMDMEKMISHVTQNVFKMMNGGGDDTEGGNPFASIFNATMGAMGKQESEVSEDPEPIGYPKTRDICFDLNVDLEDFYIGKKKKLNVRRKRIIEVDGKQKVVEEKKKIIIPIERGMKDEQSIRFRGEADQIPGYAPGDIIITLIENEHPVFQRDGDNLIVIKNINMYELYDITFDIKHLDSRIIRVHKGNSESLHTNDGLRKISGEGMPIFKSASDFGDLFIRFNLVIPKTIEPSKLNTFKQIFGTESVLGDTFSKKCVLEHVSETDLEELCSDYSSESDSESESDSDSSSEISVSTGSDSDSSSEPETKKKSLKRK